MPELGIIGFERSGKTSLHNAVTGADHAVGFTTHTDPHLGVVKVPDTRLEQLSALFTPKKTTPADLQYVDFPGAGFGGGSGPDPRFLTQLSQMDALIHVVRAFEEESMSVANAASTRPATSKTMTMELTFADLGLGEKRLESIATDNNASWFLSVSPPNAMPNSFDASKPNSAMASPYRAMSLTRRRPQGHAPLPLSDRPGILTLLNMSEGDTAAAESIAAQFRPGQEAEHTATAPLRLARNGAPAASPSTRLTSTAAAVGAGEDALTTAIRLSYAILGLRSFFTVGEDECRAWTIHEGDNAQQAAGRIHTDLERGFIRAEVVAWDNLLSAGSEAEAKKRAQLHTEGKDYVVQDGDILHVLFNL